MSRAPSSSITVTGTVAMALNVPSSVRSVMVPDCPTKSMLPFGIHVAETAAGMVTTDSSIWSTSGSKPSVGSAVEALTRCDTKVADGIAVERNTATAKMNRRARCDDGA